MKTYSVLYNYDGSMREFTSSLEKTAYNYAYEQAASPLATNVVIREIVIHAKPGTVPTIETLWAHAVENDGPSLADDVATLREQVSILNQFCKDINDRLDLAIRHMEDARSFGWTDRLADAETLITDVMCEITDRAA